MYLVELELKVTIYCNFTQIRSDTYDSTTVICHLSLLHVIVII